MLSSLGYLLFKYIFIYFVQYDKIDSIIGIIIVF